MYLDIFHIDGQGRSQIVYQKHWKQVNPRSEALGLWFSLTLCYYCIRGKKALPKKCIYVISWEGEKVNGCIEGLAWDEGWMLGRQCNQYCADVNDTMSVAFYKIGWRSFPSELIWSICLSSGGFQWIIAKVCFNLNHQSNLGNFLNETWMVDVTILLQMFFFISSSDMSSLCCGVQV